jgi:helix-turn-helix resolvase-like protein
VEAVGQAGLSARVGDLDVQLAVTRYAAGYSIRQVAEWMGVGRTTVRKYLLIAGVPLRPQGDNRNRLDVRGD